MICQEEGCTREVEKGWDFCCRQCERFFYDRKYEQEAEAREMTFTAEDWEEYLK